MEWEIHAFRTCIVGVLLELGGSVMDLQETDVTLTLGINFAILTLK